MHHAFEYPYSMSLDSLYEAYIKGVNLFQSTLIKQRGGTESKFVARFMVHEMAIYDSIKEVQMAKLKIKYCC